MLTPRTRRRLLEQEGHRGSEKDATASLEMPCIDGTSSIYASLAQENRGGGPKVFEVGFSPEKKCRGRSFRGQQGAGESFGIRRRWGWSVGGEFQVDQKNGRRAPADDTLSAGGFEGSMSCLGAWG